MKLYPDFGQGTALSCQRAVASGQLPAISCSGLADRLGVSCQYNNFDLFLSELMLLSERAVALFPTFLIKIINSDLLKFSDLFLLSNN